MEPCVVLVGNLSEGFTVHGPFASFDLAAAWCNAHGGAMGGSWVMTLQKAN